MKNKRIFLNYWSLVYFKSFKTITTIHFYGLLLLRYKTKKKKKIEKEGKLKIN